MSNCISAAWMSPSAFGPSPMFITRKKIAWFEIDDDLPRFEASAADADGDWNRG